MSALTDYASTRCWLPADWRSPYAARRLPTPKETPFADAVVEVIQEPGRVIFVYDASLMSDDEPPAAEAPR